LIATLQLPSGFTPSSSYSTISHVGDLKSGDSKLISFYFDVEDDINSEEYEATLNLDYTSEGEEENKKLTVNLPIFLIPQFEIVSIEKITENIYPGVKSKIKIGLKNIASKDAKDVSFKVYQRSDHLLNL
jgi:hypothetical protein